MQVGVLANEYQNYCKKDSPNYLYALSPRDVKGYFTAVNGLEKEHEAKLADPSALSDPRDAKFAQMMIDIVVFVKKLLQFELSKREYSSARAGQSALLSGKYFCKLVKNPENVAKLADFEFNNDDVDFLKDVHRRECTQGSSQYHQPLLKKNFIKKIFG